MINWILGGLTEYLTRFAIYHRRRRRCCDNDNNFEKNPLDNDKLNFKAAVCQHIFLTDEKDEEKKHGTT